MTCSSSLTDDLTPLVLDTSVLINLYACTFGKQALAALPNDIIVPDIVIQELAHETSKNNGEHQFLESLISQGHIQSAPLNDGEWSVYERLITETPSLGDGEAATIAVAATQGFLPVIDDGKGRSQAIKIIPSKSPAWSLDIFMHPNVEAELVNGQHIEAIHLALRNGRMRIDDARCDAVVNLIGVDRALYCNSLPNFKVRRAVWQSKVG